MSRKDPENEKAPYEEDYLRGKRLTEKLVRPTVWVSHSTWECTPDKVPEQARFLIPKNAIEIILMSYKSFTELKKFHGAEGGLILELRGMPNYFSSVYTTSQGTVLFSNPHLHGDKAFEVLALYKVNEKS